MDAHNADYERMGPLAYALSTVTIDLRLPGDKRSLCGVKKPLPVVWAPFVDAHVKGWGMVVCPACAALIDGDR